MSAQDVTAATHFGLMNTPLFVCFVQKSVQDSLGTPAGPGTAESYTDWPSGQFRPDGPMWAHMAAQDEASGAGMGFGIGGTEGQPTRRTAKMNGRARMVLPQAARQED